MTPTEPDALHFERQLRWIKAHFPVISLPEAASLLSSGNIDSPKVVITFDDGYSNNAKIALPMLQKHGLSAAFFVVTDELDGGIMWNDVITEAFRLTQNTNFKLSTSECFGTHNNELDGSQLKAFEAMAFSLNNLSSRQEQAEQLIQQVKYLSASARERFMDYLVDLLGVDGRLPQSLMMTSEQVKLLSDSGMTVGAHACRHDVLTSLSTAEAQLQITQSKSVLESITNQSIDYYAYPNGKLGIDFTHEHAQMVKAAGYKAALSTTRGAAKPSSDIFQLPRIMPWRRSRFGFNLNLLETLYQ